MVVTLTRQGQLSIPKRIQQRLGLQDGMEMNLRVINDQIVLEPKPRGRRDAIGIPRPIFPSKGFDTSHDWHNESL